MNTIILSVANWVFSKKKKKKLQKNKPKKPSNSGGREKISVETWNIKSSFIQTEGGQARGAPYLATNYTWSKKREEEEIKTKARL